MTGQGNNTAGKRSGREHVAPSDLMRALDLPDYLRDAQDAYWMVEREWQELDRAYRIVVADILNRRAPGTAA